MKRIVICMDGTWQTLSQDRLTNIGIIARSVAHKETIPGGGPGGTDRYIHQTVIYTHGVGSTIGAVAKRGFLGGLSASLNRLAGGAFGEGLEDGIVDTYLRLVFDYEAGDEIYIFGFSRGAFAARRLAGFINSAGIVSRRYAEKAWMGFRMYQEKPGDDAPDDVKAEHDERENQFRMLYGKGDRNEDGSRRKLVAPPEITYLGVFDTVVQRGAAEVLSGFAPVVNRRYKFRNYRVCPNVLSARHAVAIDERRVGFPSTLWQDLDVSNAEAQKRPGADPKRKYYDQRWFVGTHGDIGGGDSNGLSALALKWIAEGAAAQGLRFYATHGDDESPLDETLRHADLSFEAPIKYPSFWKALQPINYPLRTRKIWSKREKPTYQDAEITFDESVFKRALADHIRPRYRPGPLRPFQKVWKDYGGGKEPPASV